MLISLNRCPIALATADRLNANDAQWRCDRYPTSRAPQRKGQSCKVGCGGAHQGSHPGQLGCHSSSCGRRRCCLCCGRRSAQAQDCSHPHRWGSDPPGAVAQCILCTVWHLLWVCVLLCDDRCAVLCCAVLCITHKLRREAKLRGQGCLVQTTLLLVGVPDLASADDQSSTILVHQSHADQAVRPAQGCGLS